jgi:hypothetical protein
LSSDRRITPDDGIHTLGQGTFLVDHCVKTLHLAGKQ